MNYVLREYSAEVLQAPETSGPTESKRADTGHQEPPASAQTINICWHQR